MSVRLDGQDGAALDELCATHQKLEITTGDGPKLCLGVLDNLEPFLDQLAHLHETAASLLHQGKMSEFSQALAALLQGWTLVIGGVRNLGAVMGGLPGTENLPLDDMRARTADLNQAVLGLKTTFERQDPSRLADVLEYDLAERLPYWKGVLATLRGALKPS